MVYEFSPDLTKESGLSRVVFHDAANQQELSIGINNFMLGQYPEWRNGSNLPEQEVAKAVACVIEARPSGLKL